MEVDRKLRKGEGVDEYHDPEFEKYDKETDELDTQLSYQYDMPDDVPEVTAGGAVIPPGKPAEYGEGSWEDVEITSR